MGANKDKDADNEEEEEEVEEEEEEEETREEPQVIETGDSIKVKQVLDDAALNTFVYTCGVTADYRLDNIKLLVMFVSCLFAMTAQFYPMPFPQSRPLLGVCCFGYAALSAVLQYIVTFIDKDTIMITKARNGTPEALRIRASFPKYQEYYTLTIQPKDDPTQATVGKMYVGKYFTGKGEFDEAGFSLDVQKHLKRFEQNKVGEFSYNHKSD